MRLFPEIVLNPFLEIHPPEWVIELCLANFTGEHGHHAVVVARGDPQGIVFHAADVPVRLDKPCFGVINPFIIFHYLLIQKIPVFHE